MTGPRRKPLATLLIAFAMWAARDERVLGVPALLFATIVAVSGALFYPLTKLINKPQSLRETSLP